ncbi:MAG: alginate lyase family protein, partial [Calditrichaeota bacterium]|nr:alginate lyase family protein [Calditrichota bacterium]
RVERLPWAQKVAHDVIRSADAWLEDPLPFPEVLTGYYHDYFCPKHAVQLLFDPRSPHQHFCPVDSQAFTGEKYDGAWAFLVHLKAQQALENLALAAALTGKAAYAEAALDWLRQVRDVYLSLPPHGKHAGQGKLMGQSLDEAVWAVSATRAYDILRLLGFVPEQEHRLFVRRLWKPMAKLLQHELRVRKQIHNITCWRDAGVASLAAVMGDHSMLRRVVLSAPFSLRNQLRFGVAEDGLWHEGSLGYHFYALQALLAGTRVARLNELNLGSENTRLLAMLKAPVGLADSQGHLPALNDGWPNGSLQSYERLYELAAVLFPGAGLDSVVAWLVAHGASRGPEALLFGPEQLPPAKLTQRSRLFASTGLAVLRRGGAYALLKFGPHGGHHGHFDKLEFILNLDGEWVSPDFGTAGYGIPAYRAWYKRTASHNCVVVDGKNQQAGNGELLAFGSAGRWEVVRARSQEVVPGVVLDRTLALGDSCLLVVDWIRAESLRTLDWHFRAAGTLESSLNWHDVARPLKGDGYSYYANVREALPGERWTLAWQTPVGPLRLLGIGLPQDTLFVGDEPGIPTTRRYPFVLVRRRARRATFVALLTWKKSPGLPEIQLEERPEENRLTLRLQESERTTTQLTLRWVCGGKERTPCIEVECGWAFP